jgi:DNA-binding NtrC family response regulator
MLTDNFRLTADDFAPILPSASTRSLGASRPVRHYAELLEEFERTTIQKALGDCAGKVTVTAKMLGMSRAGLYRKLASLGMKSRT